VQDYLGASTSEMTSVVSGGALNSIHFGTTVASVNLQLVYKLANESIRSRLNYCVVASCKISATVSGVHIHGCLWPGKVVPKMTYHVSCES